MITQFRDFFINGKNMRPIPNTHGEDCLGNLRKKREPSLQY